MNKALVFVPALLCACASMTSGDPATAAERTSMQRGIQIQSVETRQANYCGYENTCNVTVKVDKDCVVTADPYAFVVGGTARPVTLVWRLEGPQGAKFAGDGVYFKEEDGRRVFKRVSGGPGSAEEVFRDGGVKGIYHYTVTVSVGGRTCDTLDPTGINDM
jgi:hypothetical protein